MPFVRPGTLPKHAPYRLTSEAPAGSPVEDIAKFEAEHEEAEDYRRRQMANAAGFGACVLLVLIGVWIAITMADLRRNQDCVLAGRKNCAQISIIGTSLR